MTKQRMLMYMFTAAMVFAALAFAGKGPNRPCPADPNAGFKGLKGPGDWMKDKLGLTDEQATQLEQLRTTYKEQMKTAVEQRMEKRKALEEAVQSGADEATIQAAATELGKAIGDASVLRAKHFAEVKNILTPEQQATLEQLKEKGKERFGKRGPGRFGKGPGAEDGDARPMMPMGRRGEGMGPRGEGRMGRMVAPERGRFFEMRDTDGDGKLSLEEFTAGREKPTAEDFKNADTDGDGYLTIDEFRDSIKKIMLERRPQD